MKKIKVSVIGATGYTGAELVDAIGNHPNFQLLFATGRGLRLSDTYNSLLGREGDVELISLEQLFNKKEIPVDLIFLALPHGSSMEVVTRLKDFKGKIIDLSGDFRLRDSAAYCSWYKKEHLLPNMLNDWVYTLPEITSWDLIKEAKYISCPGCYPTATTLAIYPLVKSEYILKEGSVIVDAKSGISGGGKGFNDANHYCQSDESIMAYKVFKHQHKPEILENIKAMGREDLSLIFTPHLVPMKRGILVTVYIKCKEGLDINKLHKMYEEKYGESRFVTILPKGMQPKTSNVTYTNNCQIGLSYEEESNMAIITSVIDNLGKGASLQAIQNANIAFSLEEDAGLTGKFKVI